MKFTYILSAFLFSCVAISQQSTTFIPRINSIPSSPEAALLGRFGDIPVSHYTGTPDISIPLYTVKMNNVEIPIVLKYQSSGIKVADEATWVGLGWSLDPEASIMQEVRGIIDDFDNYNLSSTMGVDPSQYAVFKSHLLGANYSSTPQTGDCLKYAPYPLNVAWLCGVPSVDSETVLTSLQSGKGQPDVFHYNLPGYSGKYFNNPETGVPTLMDKKDDIRFVSNVQNQKAVTPDGNIFWFNTYESSQSGGSSTVSGRTYKVTSIDFPGSSAHMSFTYQDELYKSTYSHANIVFNAMEVNQSNTLFSNGESYTTGTKKRLSQIVTPEITVIFNVSGREDFLQNASNTISKLESIEIRSTITGKKIKSFVFSYSYFNPAGNYLSKRLKLLSVKEVGFDYDTQVADLSKPAHSFEYDESVNLPMKTSRGRDLWGYYNGYDSNTTLLPDLDFFDYRQQITDSNNNPAFEYHPSYKANRYADNSKAKAWLIKKVTYPTGGFTEYTFEPHVFDNQFIPNQPQLALMAKSATCNNGPYYPSPSEWEEPLNVHEDVRLVMNINFTHGNPQSSGGGINTAVTGPIYYNSYVKITKTTTSGTVDVKKWTPGDNMITYQQFEANGGTNYNEEFFLDYEPGAIYKLKAYCPSLPTSTYIAPLQAVGAHVSTTFFDKTAVPHVSTQGGFRIRDIRSYTGQGVLAHHKQYTYTGGKLLNTFMPLRVLPAAYHINYVFGGVGHPDWNSVFAKRIFLSTENFGNESGNPIGYDMVEEVSWDDQNSTTAGKKRFYFHNEMNLGRTGLPNSPNYQNGLVIKEETFDNNDNLLEDKINTYVHLPYTYIPSVGITIETCSLGELDVISTTTVVTYGVTPFEYKFRYDTYPLICEWIKLDSTVSNQYYGGNVVSSTTTYEYNATGQQRAVVTTASDGQELKTFMEYAIDSPFGDAIEQVMETDHMIDIPIKTEVTRNNLTIATTKNEYAKNTNTSNRVQQKSIYSLKGGITGGTLEKRVTTDLYDNRGNILQYHLEEGIPVSIVWGYDNTLPVAKIEGIAYDNLNAVIASIQSESSSATGSEATLLAYLDQLRQAHPDAMVTTYTYKPGVGVSTITDAKKDRTSYTYDSFGRLKEARDGNGNILSENKYNYRP